MEAGRGPEDELPPPKEPKLRDWGESQWQGSDRMEDGQTEYGKTTEGCGRNSGKPRGVVRNFDRCGAAL